MDQLLKFCGYSKCKKEDVLPEANKKNAPNNEKVRNTPESVIPAKKDSNHKINTTSKTITDALHKLEIVVEPTNTHSGKNLDVGPENFTKSVVLQVDDPKFKLERDLFQHKLACSIKSSERLEKEKKIKTVLTAQDIFRLRVPQPTNVVERVCNNCNFFQLREPRDRKPILVLDLDTLRLIYPAIVPDRKPTILNLLESVYKNFDIAIWSSLKMDALISKLKTFELFRVKNKFNINFVLDKTSMTSPLLTHYAMLKDIEVIRNLYPQYNEHNSIIVNDHLKDVIYSIYGIPVKTSKTIQLVDEVALKVIVDYLAETTVQSHTTTRRSFRQLNMLAADRYYQ